ncbi:mandelate racemase/muconate lactonizing enzyme family protein [Agrobacterium vitis]|uniref:mandelate racemase/muconate lactonizing enzyme family protein n=1 Tax=Agrobacterium vitis TaxID=373 RepID=UPI0018D2E7E5
MRITSLKTFVVHALRVNHVFVVLETDAGITGVGEGTVEDRELAAQAAIQHTESYLIGQDPFRITCHVETLSRDSYWRTGALLRSALSAIEMALLDIKGKALGVPVYDLLGGLNRDVVPCYANGWFGNARSPDEFAAAARQTTALGFAALKLDPFRHTSGKTERSRLLQGIARIEAVRDAVGPDIEIMIDGHGGFDATSAILAARELEPFRPYWFEEPVPPESIDALASVRRRSPIPIAAGERVYEPARFAEIIDREAVDYLQPDISHVGGISEALRIASYADVHNVPVVPHNALGPVNNAATLHYAAAVPNFSWFESFLHVEPFVAPWRADYVEEAAFAEDGHIRVPGLAGLGVSIRPEACLAHPYKPRLKG